MALYGAETWTLRAAHQKYLEILQTGRITLSYTPDQQLENHSTKYHRQQPLYNTLELLMMGVVVPEIRSASNKICNKNLCCIWLAFYFHIQATLVRRLDPLTQRYSATSLKARILTVLTIHNTMTSHQCSFSLEVS